MAILFADGFALAFVITGSLWLPTIWHIGKNLSVWLFLGSGTIDVTHGPFEFQYVSSESIFDSPSSAGLLDLAITILIVGLVICSLLRRRARDVKTV